MCGRVVYHKNVITPGSYMNFIGVKGEILAGEWGLRTSKPKQYLARIESMTTTWQGYMPNRGLLELEGFYEGPNYFHMPDHVPFYVPVLYSKDYDFLILTRSASLPVLAVHPRQPLIIYPERGDEWLQRSRLTKPPTDLTFTEVTK